MDRCRRLLARQIGACGVLVLVLSGPVQAGLFFVDPNGSDAGTGSASDPWRTLQHAADTVVGGDTVSVRSGSYTGFQLSTSGSAGSLIQFIADPNVVINAANSFTADGINLEGASHVVVDGFRVEGVGRAGIRAVGTATNHSQFVTIRNNITDQNGRWGIFTGYSEDLTIDGNVASRSGAEHGIYVSNSADRPTITGNTVFGNAQAGIQINADGELAGDGIITGANISRNRIYDNGSGGAAGINLDGVQDSLIANNLLYGNHATGIALFRNKGAAASTGNTVVNNTVVNAADGRWGITIANGSTHNTLLNNIFYSHHGFRGGVDIRSDSLTGLVSDFNAVENRYTTDGGGTLLTLAQWRALTGLDGNSFGTTPLLLFVDEAGGDFRLLATSAALDGGTSANAPGIDFFGTLRPQGSGYDIGAVENMQAVPEAGTGLLAGLIFLVGGGLTRRRGLNSGETLSKAPCR